MLNIEYKILDESLEVNESTSYSTPLYVYGWFNLTDLSGFNLNNHDFENIDDYFFSITATDDIYEWFKDLNSITYDLIIGKDTKLIKCYDLDVLPPYPALIFQKKELYLKTFTMLHNDNNYITTGYKPEVPKQSYIKNIVENEEVLLTQWVEELCNKTSLFISEIIEKNNHTSDNLELKELMNISSLLRNFYI